MKLKTMTDFLFLNGLGFIMKKLREVLPREFKRDFMDTRAAKFLDVDVVAEYDDRPFPQKRYIYRNIYTWWELKNGYAVGWNESPRNGWSFPAVKMEGSKA